MKAVDLYVFLGNAPDNAIGYCKTIENYCGSSPVFKDGLPQTIKEDRQNRAYGTKNIRYAAEKYGG